MEEFAKTYKFDLNPDLTGDQRYAVLNVMYQYKSVFARSLQDVKIFRGMQLDLDLKNPKAKSYTRQYPQGHKGHTLKPVYGKGMNQQCHKRIKPVKSSLANGQRISLTQGQQ